MKNRESTTIKLFKCTVHKIRELKLYPSEPYEGTIIRAIDALKKNRHS